MYCRRYTVAVTTDAQGAATAYTDELTGAVLSIHYVKPGAGGFDNGSTITVTGETTGTAIWAESNVNASASRAPRQATYGTTGTAALYAGGGTAVQDLIHLGAERVKIVVASGGATKNATFYIVVG